MQVNHSNSIICLCVFLRALAPGVGAVPVPSYRGAEERHGPVRHPGGNGLPDHGPSGGPVQRLLSQLGGASQGPA